MKEIEIKFRVQDAGALAATLAARGCALSEAIEQDDRLFLPPGASYPVPPGVPVLRVRRQSGKPSLLTLKASDAGNELSKLEIETTVSNAAAAAAIVSEMGYVEVLRIQKRRRKGSVNGAEICVDEVDGLGSFVELERIAEADPVPIQAELIELAASLGIDVSARVMKGYDTMLAERQ